MKRSTTANSKARGASPAAGFTLLEVMVSVAILAVAIVPMLYLREVSFHKAMATKALRAAQQLAQDKLSEIALEVRSGEGSGAFEGWDDFRFDYTVTLYDFSSGFGDEELDEAFDLEDRSNPSDGLFRDDELKEIGPMMMRHVELTVTYSVNLGDDGGEENEYVIDTYMPALLTEQQFEYQQDNAGEEEEDQQP